MIIMKKAVVIGGGSWGVALASAIAKKIGKSFILTSSSTRSEEINSGNSTIISKNCSGSEIIAGTVSKEILHDASLIIIATEVKRALSFCDDINKFSPCKTVVLIASKGFSEDGQVLPVALKSKLKERSIGVLSGPSFATEVIEEKPTALVVAGTKHLIELSTEILHTNKLRIYGSSDDVGTSVSGAMKNVIAIASGIVFGLELGENARAAILTRGLAETSRLVVGLGGKIETVFGLAGAGDMALSCLSSTSRNFSWGYLLAKNQSTKEVLVEGINAAKMAMFNANKLKIEMPITELVAKASQGNLDLTTEVKRMLERPPKLEWK